MKCILNDDMQYKSQFFPTHIVSKDKKVLPVFIGAPQTMINGLIGIYVKDEDYPLIRHDRAYIFIHNPNVVDDEIDHIDWGNIPIVGDDQDTINREHIHLWK